MNIGALRQRVEFQTKPAFDDADIDDGHQEEEVWTTEATYYASVIPLSGRELTNALAIRNDVSHKITLRWFGVVNPALARFKMGERLFNIISAINVDERSRELSCICTEVVSR